MKKNVKKLVRKILLIKKYCFLLFFSSFSNVHLRTKCVHRKIIASKNFHLLLISKETYL